MIFSRLAVLLVGAVASVNADATDIKVAKRAIQPNPSNGHWVDAWASMPQLTEPANLPPAPFVRALKLNCSIRTDNSLEPIWRCFRQLHSSPDTVRDGASEPDPPQDFQCVRWLKSADYSYYGRIAGEPNCRHPSNPAKHCTKGHLLWQSWYQYSKRGIGCFRSHQLRNQGRTNRHSLHVSGLWSDHEQHHLASRIPNNKLVSVWQCSRRSPD